MKMNIPSMKRIGTTALFVLSFTILTASFGAAQSAEHCANGPKFGPHGGPPVPCSGDAWEGGNLGVNNSQWVEGDSVPTRAFNDGLTGTGLTLTITYDTLKNGLHAYDYLTTWNRSALPGSDACSDVAGADCSLASQSTFAIPLDPNVAAGQDGIPGNGDDIVQIPGVFTMYGGTITGVSGYTNSGTDTVETSITITYNPGPTGVVVLAWGAHIASRVDWGVGNSAGNINGSPYHQDVGGHNLSLSAGAVVFPARVRIFKDAIPLIAGNAQTFSFTSTNFGDPLDYPSSAFTLNDNGTDADGFSNVETRLIEDFLPEITVTENTSIGFGWSLTNLVCVDSDGGFGFTANSTPQAPGTLGPTATIRVQEGELVDCTFTNSQQQPTAAKVTVDGRTVGTNGRGIAGVTVTLTNAASGETKTATSNTFGFFSFTNVEVENSYILTASSSRYTFDPLSFALEDTLSGLVLVGRPR